VTSRGDRRLTALQAIFAAAHLRPTRLEDESLRTKVDHLPGTKQPGGQKLISYDEVQKHASRDSCWVIIDVSVLPDLRRWGAVTDFAQAKVYDVTDFLEAHPGGEGIILANAGKDAT
jgi:L-lactate dehydrogenase (cytochrome)